MLILGCKGNEKFESWKEEIVSTSTYIFLLTFIGSYQVPKESFGDFSFTKFAHSP